MLTGSDSHSDTHSEVAQVAKELLEIGCAPLILDERRVSHGDRNLIAHGGLLMLTFERSLQHALT